jgi:hypothetical protein
VNKLLESIITEDETLVSHFTPHTKQSGLQLKLPISARAKKFKVWLSAGNVVAYVESSALNAVGPNSQRERLLRHTARLCEACHGKTSGYLRWAEILQRRIGTPQRASHTKVVAVVSLGTSGSSPCIPDLAPFGFRLFGPMKKHLGGRRFHNRKRLLVIGCECKILISTATEYLNSCLDETSASVCLGIMLKT